MAHDQPPEGNDLGQNAVPQTHLTLGNFGPKSQERPPYEYEICDICGFPYKKKEMVKFRNKWYCRPNQCNRDVQGILLRENPDKYEKNQGLSDRFYTRGS